MSKAIEKKLQELEDRIGEGIRLLSSEYNLGARCSDDYECKACPERLQYLSGRNNGRNERDAKRTFCVYWGHLMKLERQYHRLQKELEGVA